MIAIQTIRDMYGPGRLDLPATGAVDVADFVRAAPLDGRKLRVLYLALDDARRRQFAAMTLSFASLFLGPEFRAATEAVAAWFESGGDAPTVSGDGPGMRDVRNVVTFFTEHPPARQDDVALVLAIPDAVCSRVGGDYAAALHSFRETQLLMLVGLHGCEDP